MFAQLGVRGTSLLFSSGDAGVGGGPKDCETNDGKHVTQFQPMFPATCEPSPIHIHRVFGCRLTTSGRTSQAPSLPLSEEPPVSSLRQLSVSLEEDSRTTSPNLLTRPTPLLLTSRTWAVLTKDCTSIAFSPRLLRITLNLLIIVFAVLPAADSRMLRLVVTTSG